MPDFSCSFFPNLISPPDVATMNMQILYIFCIYTNTHKHAFNLLESLCVCVCVVWLHAYPYIYIYVLCM